MTQAEDELEDSSAPLIEHLAELRTRLIRSAIAFIISVFVCFYFAGPIFDFLKQPVCHAMAERMQACNLQMIRLQDGFFVQIRIAMLAGFALSFPVIGFQLWRFVAPGLYRNERSAFLPFMISSPAMFLLGAAFCYYIVIPLAYDFFLGFQDFGGGAVPVTNGETADDGQLAVGSGSVVFQGSISEYLSLTITFVMAFGICFQLPVLLTLLGTAGLVSSAGLAAMRKYAVVAILVLAGIVTPPDVFTQIILFVAVYGLYEVSIFLVARVERKRTARLRAEGILDEDEEF
ncbi:MAG: twin-arginine translocase subunit TatC [Vannielia sp.]|uniref:twin-arginine translocase subunit TatC n=1 Tax=Rhodobacterales TaxID=204455 RepID=UPI002094FBDB|nr:twin-arginine translocase subunit TatC [Oceanicola sp. 502str15]MCO6382447.1 twin-arginine translocase subunit TatC [Oceanicola sp. 502str15]